MQCQFQVHNRTGESLGACPQMPIFRIPSPEGVEMRLFAELEWQFWQTEGH